MSKSISRRALFGAGSAGPASALSPGALDSLRYRVLGKTGLKVTTVGMGCVLITDTAVLAQAADLGINHFDTARDYQGSNSERAVGSVLKSRRKSVVIATKTGAENARTLFADVDLSLKELQTDYIDILYIPGRKAASEITAELIDGHQRLKKQGKIRFTGVSTHRNHADVIPAVVANPKVDVLECSYNFTLEPAMEGLLESARKAKLGVVAMKVMAGGYKNGADAEKRRGAMLAALKWVLRNPDVHSTAVSMADTDQLEEDLRAMSQPFRDGDRKVLAAQLEHIRPLYCRMCGRCDGACRLRLPVEDMLRTLTYAEGYGNFPLGRERFLALPETAVRARCGECEGCTVNCPSGVRVRERLIRAQEIFA